MSSYQTMSRAEAERIATWVEANLIAGEMAQWHRETLVTVLMYPDLESSMSLNRRRA